MGRFLTNREASGYFREADIAKTHKLHTGIAGHCVAMEFIKQSGAGGAEEFQGDFGKFARTIDEYLNTDALGKQFGESDVYDSTKMNSGNNSRIPGSRGKGNARDERGSGKKEIEEMRI